MSLYESQGLQPEDFRPLLVFPNVIAYATKDDRYLNGLWFGCIQGTGDFSLMLIEGINNNNVLGNNHNIHLF